MNIKVRPEFKYDAAHHARFDETAEPSLKGRTWYRRLPGGEFYVSETTTQAQADALVKAYQSSERVRLHYGDRETGRDWGDEFMVYGRVSRSMGPVRIPILVHSRTSLGGAPVLADSIVRLRSAARKDGGDFYRHPRYHVIPEQCGAYGSHDWDKVYAKHFAPSPATYTVIDRAL